VYKRSKHSAQNPQLQPPPPALKRRSHALRPCSLRPALICCPPRLITSHRLSGLNERVRTQTPGASSPATPSFPTTLLLDCHTRTCWACSTPRCPSCFCFTRCVLCLQFYLLQLTEKVGGHYSWIEASTLIKQVDRLQS